MGGKPRTTAGTVRELPLDAAGRRILRVNPATQERDPEPGDTEDGELSTEERELLDWAIEAVLRECWPIACNTPQYPRKLR